jgi:transcriptional regulator of acetoin/glycerol metabolism
MRVDPASTTDSEATPDDARRPAPDLSLDWLAPEPVDPPLKLDWTDAEERILGRDDGCVTKLRGTDVSRRHAALARTDTEFLLLDLGSRNGTRLNGRAIKSARLAPGDVIRIGAHVGVVTVSATPFSELGPGLFGGGVLKAALRELEEAAPSDLPIVLEGETGTGKEVVARCIHAWSGRGGEFVGVNCAALPENLAEAELFGYRRGAFTGAERASLGLLRSADGGTLLLDEISDLSLAVQAKLLRALETREVLPLGEARPVPVDVRVVAAGQTSLFEAVRERRFRADLLARIDGLSVRLPPLRERREDVLPLFSRLWSEIAAGPLPALDTEFIERLCAHDWPLNVRELVLLVRRLKVLCARETKLRAQHLPGRIGPREEVRPIEAEADAQTAPAVRAPGVAAEVGLSELVVALRASGGNVARASELLGISRQRAYRLMEANAVDIEELRK